MLTKQRAPALPAAFSARRLGGALTLAAGLLLAACSHDADPVATPSPATATYPAEVATKWADVELMLVMNGTGFTPPVTSRALDYAGAGLRGRGALRSRGAGHGQLAVPRRPAHRS